MKRRVMKWVGVCGLAALAVSNARAAAADYRFYGGSYDGGALVAAAGLVIPALPFEYKFFGGAYDGYVRAAQAGLRIPQIGGTLILFK